MKKQIAMLGLLAIITGCTGTDNKIVDEQPLPDIYAKAYEEFKNDEKCQKEYIEILKNYE